MARQSPPLALYGTGLARERAQAGFDSELHRLRCGRYLIASPPQWWILLV